MCSCVDRLAGHLSRSSYRLNYFVPLSLHHLPQAAPKKKKTAPKKKAATKKKAAPKKKKTATKKKTAAKKK